MAIYRGPGGSGDATDDAANAAELVIQKTAEAAASATSAAASAANAATSAASALTSADNAAISEANAAAYASQASSAPATPTTTGTVFGRTDTGTYTPPTSLAYSGTVNETSYSIYADTNGDYLGDVFAVKTAISNNTLQVGLAISFVCFNTVTNAYESLDGGVITALSNSGASFTITFSNAIDFSNMQRASIFWYSKLMISQIAFLGDVAENVTLGLNAGTGITTGGENVLIGTAAGNNVGSGRNNVVIGNAATASAQDVSNEVTLGNSNHTKTRLFGALAMGGSSVGTSGQVLTSNGSGSAPSWSTPYSGTVTSVALTAPTGLTVSGSPITSSGTLALSLTTGYSIPTTASQANWDTAYGWGNHASAGYLTSATAATTYAPLTGTGTSGTWGISITGNAATVTNGLYSTGTYSNPSWLTTLAGSKITGTISGGTY